MKNTIISTGPYDLRDVNNLSCLFLIHVVLKLKTLKKQPVF